MSVPRPSRIPSLDGLRAVSILLVIGGHLWDRYLGPSGLSVLAAALGVQVFFVLSGYLISRLLQEEHERNGQISLTAFYRRRCFRIFPAAFAYILIVALLSPASRSGLLYAITYTVSYHPSTPTLFWHLWSLSVEEQFYLIWPLALLAGFRHRGKIAGAAMLIAAAFRLGLALNPAQQTFLTLHHSFPTTMDSIAAGCLLAIYEPQIRERCRKMADCAALVLAIPVITLVWAAFCWAGKMSVLWGTVPLLLALSIFLLIERRDWILNNPVAMSIGVLSYSLYLWQEPFTKGQHYYPTAASLLILSACAVASYLMVEKPMLRVGARMSARSVRHSTSPAAALP